MKCQNCEGRGFTFYKEESIEYPTCQFCGGSGDLPKIKKVVAYKTTDGTLFSLKRQAIDHQRTIKLEKNLLLTKT